MLSEQRDSKGGGLGKERKKEREWLGKAGGSRRWHMREFIMATRCTIMSVAAPETSSCGDARGGEVIIEEDGCWR